MTRGLTTIEKFSIVVSSSLEKEAEQIIDEIKMLKMDADNLLLNADKNIDKAFKTLRDIYYAKADGMLDVDDEHGKADSGVIFKYPYNSVLQKSPFEMELGFEKREIHMESLSRVKLTSITGMFTNSWLKIKTTKINQNIHRGVLKFENKIEERELFLTPDDNKFEGDYDYLELLETSDNLNQILIVNIWEV